MTDFQYYTHTSLQLAFAQLHMKYTLKNSIELFFHSLKTNFRWEKKKKQLGEQRNPKSKISPYIK